MANHESHDDHGQDMTEGKRQYYPKGWYLPLVGLFVVAFLFTLGAGSLLGISGTDKWGKKEQCCDMEKCKDGDKEKCDGKNCDMKNCKDNMGSNSMMDTKNNNDSANVSVAPKSDCTMVDTAKVQPGK